MSRKKILYICGSLNQTTIMHQIYQSLQDYEGFFTPFYADGYIKMLTDIGLLDFTIMGGQIKQRTMQYLQDHNLAIDYEAKSNSYDLVVTCSDLVVPENIKSKKIILVQEGMTDPENFGYQIVKNFNLPRYLANTAMTGLSDAYIKFCVASEGFKEFFIKKGVKPEKIIVTGIPNFDNVHEYLDNDFPHRNYVLVATSHLRETFKYENRKQFIQRALAIADGRQIIFKLHPNENVDRAVREINKYAPGCLIFTNGNTNHMIANCDILVTRYSSVLLVALALRKTIYSDLDSSLLSSFTPWQNGGTSAEHIARVCRHYLD